MSFANQTVLCIGNTHRGCQPIAIMLEQLGYQVVYSTAEEGLGYALGGKFRAIMMDNRLEDIRRAEIHRQLRSHDAVTPIIFFNSRRTESLTNKLGGKSLPVQV